MERKLDTGCAHELASSAEVGGVRRIAVMNHQMMWANIEAIYLETSVSSHPLRSKEKNKSSFLVVSQEPLLLLTFAMV